MAVSARSGGGQAAAQTSRGGSSEPALTLQGAAVGDVSGEAPASASLVALLTVPERVSIGREFVVLVQVPNAAGANVGEVELSFDAGLLQAGASAAAVGRATVRLTSSGETLDGSIVLRAQAAGTGTTAISVANGAARMKDGAVVQIGGGASATLRIGL